MKYLSVISILLVIILYSCSDNSTNSDYKYNITFINETSYTLTISDAIGGDFETFSIASGQTKSIKSKNQNIFFNISHPKTDKIISYETISSNKFRLFEYNYTVQYKIFGTAHSVNVTLNNPSGGTEQYSNISLPKTYSYKHFEDNFLYISAQNNGESGSITVQIYYQDKLFKSSSASGAYVIATASGSKP